MRFFSTPLTRAATPKTPDVARLGFPRRKTLTNRSTGKRGFTSRRAARPLEAVRRARLQSGSRRFKGRRRLANVPSGEKFDVFKPRRKSLSSLGFALTFRRRFVSTNRLEQRKRFEISRRTNETIRPNDGRQHDRRFANVRRRLELRSNAVAPRRTRSGGRSRFDFEQSARLSSSGRLGGADFRRLPVSKLANALRALAVRRIAPARTDVLPRRFDSMKLDAGRLIVFAPKTERYKNNGVREVPIAPILRRELVAHLKTMPQNEDFLIYENRRKAFDSGFRKIIFAAGLKNQSKTLKIISVTI